jgi:pantetheine-phosphate adenylyltransferase
MRVAVYPGTFDPITNGHIDLAKRAARLFDRLIVAVYSGGDRNPKRPLFTTEERVAMARHSLSDIPHVEIDTFQNLTVDYARSVGAQILVRGLRAVSDFEYEFKLAHMYQHLAPELEVVCLMTSSAHSFISPASSARWRRWVEISAISSRSMSRRHSACDSMQGSLVLMGAVCLCIPRVAFRGR